LIEAHGQVLPVQQGLVTKLPVDLIEQSASLAGASKIG